MEFTPEEVSLYLGAVGLKQTPDATGMLRFPCPFPSSGPPHHLLMNPQTGLWTDQGDHGRGDLPDFELGRSRLCDFRAAGNAVLKIIREAKENKRRAEEARKAARGLQVADLPRAARSLLGVIDRHPEGIDRRTLQQGSHMRSAEFRKGLKDLERRSSIRSHWVPTRRRRRPKIVYVPVANSEALSDKESELARKTDAGKVS